MSRVTMRMETVNPDEDFEQPPALQLAIALHRVRVHEGRVAQIKGSGEEQAAPKRDTRSKYMDCLRADKSGSELHHLNQRYAGRWGGQ